MLTKHYAHLLVCYGNVTLVLTMLSGVVRAVYILLILTTTQCLAQERVLERLWATSTDMNMLDPTISRVENLLSDVDTRRYTNDVDRLRAIFTKTHRRFLKEYDPYSDISLLSKGTFDCLTATSLFAEVLNRAGYSYSMIETNYHIFVIVQTSQGEVVLETTDRFGGFISGKKVNDKLAEYRANQLASNSPFSYRYNCDLYGEITADKLSGLLYFNQAVKAFNSHNWVLCSEKLEAAERAYVSPRVSELATVLFQAVALSNLDDATKSSILTRWRSASQMPIASRF